VNNAGVSVLAPVVQTDPSDMAHMVDVNLLGTFHGLQAAARAMTEQGRPGRIVNLASDLGVQAAPLLGGYAATKFAVVGLTQAAAVELAPLDITVNAVCPGTAETDMVVAERASEVQVRGLAPEEIRQSYLAAIPAGRFCTPADVGDAVAWLCGPSASYITGQAICVNGGSVLH
jgi:NAD(P)-dependent dehydrogenase (short-subunit alcohol dehydrogenase family)